jgi:hypothetical protein
MDMGAHEDTPNTGANASGAGTAEDAGASNKSAGIDKGKAPEVPEIRSDPATAAPGQATPAAPDEPAPKTLAPEKTTTTPATTGTTASAKTDTTAPAKTGTTAPTKTGTTAPAKTGTFKMTQIIKTVPTPAKTAPTSAKPAPSSSTLTLHTGKGAARVSSLHTPELEGRISLWTKSDKSLGSLKEYCMKWKEADYIDTASSGKKKKLAGFSAPSNPDVIPAKPIAIASELFSIQQRLYLLADATNVSILSLYLPSPRKCRLSGIQTSGIFQYPF